MKTFVVICVIAPLTLVGCVGLRREGERQARADVQAVEQNYRPHGARPRLPVLTVYSGLEDFLRFAVLNQPAVEAAYYDWAASVQRITVERSLPDPQLTFQADIMEMLMSLMPGIMQEFPGPGKLKARGAVATAESQKKYFDLENAVLQAAFNLKKSYYELGFHEQELRINYAMLSLLDDLERIARSQNETGKSTLQDVLRAQIEHDRVAAEIANQEDVHRPKLAAFKAALGLTPAQPDPPAPVKLEMSASVPDDDALLRIAFERNPRLAALAAEVRAAQAGISMAYKERVPDFNLGLMVDLKTAPVMYRPLAGLTLPVWRDKLAAEVAQAKAQELAARSRLSAEQIALTVEFAEKSFSYRELDRNLDLLQKQLLPKATQLIELARANYLSGRIGFFDLMDAQRMLLDFEMSEIDARAQREIVLAELSLLIAGTQPDGSPLRGIILKP